ncbi:unnamed protein product [Oikopleura dioica]|uniref:Uncharacterized protein n=1 Tax=Oikopleura dioica TaxID=34765 RepID=E4WXS0_OIKDI|nr:unnamed protein product [Oikopleura dioica]
MPDCQLSISRENLSSENKLWYQKSRTGPKSISLSVKDIEEYNVRNGSHTIPK